MKSFKHSGDIGDIIYALPTIRALGGGVLYLHQSPKTRVLMSEKTLDLLRPLLTEQPYIADVQMHSGEPVAYNFDLFRKYWDRHAKTSFGVSIADWHLLTFKQSITERDRAWLACESKAVAPVVFARSPRYHNDNFPWKRIVERYRDVCVFVGLNEEHGEFVTKFGRVPHYKVKNFLELAQVISGAQLFVGNQSSPFAVAEGLKKDVIQEVWLG